MIFKRTEDILDEDFLFEMSNVRGKLVKIEDLDFSFYFSSKKNVNSQHGIRVKICWNREKISKDLLDGFMELHGDYEYTPTKNPNKKADEVDISTARYFFKRYKVLFAAVWEGILDENLMSDYLRGNISFRDLLKEFELPQNKLNLILNCSDRKELESIVRKYNIFNMND